MTAPQLSTEDYSPSEIAEVHRLMSTTLTDLHRLIGSQLTADTWTPDAGGILNQFAEADHLLDLLSRCISGARAGIRDVDSRARARYLERATARTTGTSQLSAAPKPR